MKNYFYLGICAVVAMFAMTALAQAQQRIAVIPFQNADGKMENNVLCYQYQDNLQKELAKLDPTGKYYHLVPADSIENLLAQMNIDPKNPQYASDLWKAVKMLNVQSVITGNFNIQSDKIVVNAYVYNSRTKMPNRQHQAIDIFKDKNAPMSAIAEIIDGLKPLLVPVPEN
jgi:TolB-like protein